MAMPQRRQLPDLLDADQRQRHREHRKSGDAGNQQHRQHDHQQEHGGHMAPADAGLRTARPQSLPGDRPADGDDVLAHGLALGFCVSQP
jgi:hypothetical protein